MVEISRILYTGELFEMNTKLNYNVNFPKVEDKPEEEKKLKNKTKLSMQSTVMSALASTQPTGPGTPAQPSAQNNGWGKSN